MKVLHVFDHTLPIHSGYSFRSHYIITSQNAHGIDVTVLTSPKHHEEASIGENPEIRDGVRYFRTRADAYRTGIRSRRVFKEWTQVRLLEDQIVRIGRSETFDVIHAHSPFIHGIAALRASRCLGTPVAYEIRAFWEDAAVHMGKYAEGSPSYRIMKWAETRLCRKVDHVFVICQGLRSDLIGRGISSDKITVIPNGVDTSAFVPCRPVISLLHRHGLEGKKILGYIGSFYYYEGLKDLLELMALVKKERDDVRLLLVGGGDEYETIRKKVSDMELENEVILTGKVPHEQVNDYYSIIDILLYPRVSMRLTELVTALKPLEAMAMEKLVAVSRVGGLTELVMDKQTGYVFDPGNLEDMKSVVYSALEDKEGSDKIRKYARAWVEQNRNWFNNVSQHIRVYEKLVVK